MKKAFKQLLEIDLDTYEKPIRPVRRGKLASEYNDLITDYSMNQVSLTKRIIPPYSTKATHGEDVFTGLQDFLQQLSPRRLLDLGSTGELLLAAKAVGVKELYGVTIHVGEVKAQRAMGLRNVIPSDMRDLYELFDQNFFDCVVAHHVLQFIPVEDQSLLLGQIHGKLKPHGYFVIVDYYGDPDSQLNGFDAHYWQRRTDLENWPAKGRVTVLEKI